MVCDSLLLLAYMLMYGSKWFLDKGKLGALTVVAIAEAF